MNARRGFSYPVGVTGKGSHASSPVLHAMTGQRASRTGRNVLALCGASLRQVLTSEGQFVPGAPRTCPACSSSIVEANR